ncbi:glycosyltransferase family 9 protein [Streptomyces mirabilis]|uniref:glycosyltransferase family 9 protein n=1 Tax=Streptomyces mirabilis TaxID=68239 RepID=UPI00363D9408
MGSIVCDPAAPPCWSSADHVYPELPARYYLALERRLGVRLPAARPFAPLLAARPDRFSALVEQLRVDGWLSGLTIAAITATSWPQRKDYSVDRFAEVAHLVAERQRVRVQLLIVGGQHSDGMSVVSSSGSSRVSVLHLGGVPADDLVDLFPRCGLVIGNDTGLTHLAALARMPDGSGPPVVGLYARHSYSKWRTGWPHHHAVATGFSDRMHQGDLCPVRDVIGEAAGADLSAITPALLARSCTDLLMEGSR